MKLVELSTGDKVTLKGTWTHKMHKALFQATNKGVTWKEDAATGGFVKQVPADQIEFQYEAVLPLVIEKIERSGETLAYSEAWMEALPQDDYRKLENEIAKIRLGDPEASKKNR